MIEVVTYGQWWGLVSHLTDTRSTRTMIVRVRGCSACQESRYLSRLRCDLIPHSGVKNLGVCWVQIRLSDITAAASLFTSTKDKLCPSSFNMGTWNLHPLHSLENRYGGEKRVFYWEHVLRYNGSFRSVILNTKASLSSLIPQFSINKDCCDVWIRFSPSSANEYFRGELAGLSRFDALSCDDVHPRRQLCKSHFNVPCHPGPKSHTFCHRQL